MMNFSANIKSLRQELLLSQEDFAKELGMSFATVNRWETGKTHPTYKALRTLKQYCKTNGIDFSRYYNFDEVNDGKDNSN